MNPIFLVLKQGLKYALTIGAGIGLSEVLDIFVRPKVVKIVNPTDNPESSVNGLTNPVSPFKGTVQEKIKKIVKYVIILTISFVFIRFIIKKLRIKFLYN